MIGYIPGTVIGFFFQFPMKSFYKIKPSFPNFFTFFYFLKYTCFHHLAHFKISSAFSREHCILQEWFPLLSDFCTQWRLYLHSRVVTDDNKVKRVDRELNKLHKSFFPNELVTQRLQICKTDNVRPSFCMRLKIFFTLINNTGNIPNKCHPRQYSRNECFV